MTFVVVIVIVSVIVAVAIAVRITVDMHAYTYIYIYILNTRSTHICIYTHTYIQVLLIACAVLLLFPTLGVGLLGVKLTGRPVYSSLIPGVPNPKVSLECPTIECKWSEQPQRVSLKCPTPECPECPAPESPWSAQPQSLPGVPNPTECPRSAQPQSVPGVLPTLGRGLLDIKLTSHSSRLLGRCPPRPPGMVPDRSAARVPPTTPNVHPTEEYQSRRVFLEPTPEDAAEGLL